jgi:hypothetical protein
MPHTKRISSRAISDLFTSLHPDRLSTTNCLDSSPVVPRLHGMPSRYTLPILAPLNCRYFLVYSQRFSSFITEYNLVCPTFGPSDLPTTDPARSTPTAHPL